MFDKLTKGSLPQFKQALEEAHAAVDAVSHGLLDNLTAEFESFPDVVSKALLHGGNTMKAMEAVGLEMGRTLSSSLTSAIGISTAPTTPGQQQQAAQQGGWFQDSNGNWQQAPSQGVMIGSAAGVAGLQLASSFADPNTRTGGALSGAAQGAAIGTEIMPGWGTAIGAGVGAIAGALKVPEEEKQGRSTEAQFEQSFLQQGEASSQSFAEMMKGVGAAYVETGRGAELAQRDVASLLDAEAQGPEAVQKWITTIQNAITESKAMTTATDGVITQLHAITTITPDLQEALDKAFKTNTATDFDNALKGVSDILTAQQTQTQQLSSTLQKYGLDWTEAGTAAKEANLDSLAQGLITDFNTLKAGGVDVNHEMTAMGPNLNSFVTEAQKAGVQVPDAMKQVLQTAIDAGTLFDANGKKITDMGQLGLTFGTDMATATQHVADEIQHLTDVLTNGLGGALANSTTDAQKLASAINGIPSEKTVTVNVQTNDSGASYNAEGGYITGPGALYADMGLTVPGGPRGTDTVPAWLTPGEGVLSRTGMSALGGPGVLNALNRGGGVGISAADLHDAVSRAIDAAMNRLSQKLDQHMQLQPVMLRHALRGMQR
jgi:hypothetical protein